MTSGLSAAQLDPWLSDCRAWCERELDRRLPSASTPPVRLHEAMRYALFGGGKRLRPALVRLVCRHLGGRDEDAALPAAAVELVHTYSLVHDDLPCMDDDDLRRGRPTCHTVFGEALAVLAGDALLTCAFELCALARPEEARAFARSLARASGSLGMVGGQTFDLDGAPAEEAQDPRRIVHRIHSMKTAALFAASAELGAIAAGAPPAQRAAAFAFGERLGLAFQAIDDVLDVTGDAATLGKTPGKDAALERSTLVAALGLEAAREEAARLAERTREGARELPGSQGALLEALVDFVSRRSA